MNTKEEIKQQTILKIERTKDITITTVDRTYDAIARAFAHELKFINEDLFFRFNKEIDCFPFGTKNKNLLNLIIKYDTMYNVGFVEYETK